MTREEAITRLKNMAWLYGSTEREQNIEAIDMAIEALSEPSKVDFHTDKSANIDTKVNDLISRADAIEAMADNLSGGCSTWAYLNLEKAIKALPSADAEPTVVRCKTMIPYGDFREWAKRIREDNPNVIVIPFDAEVVSAEAVQGEWKHTITWQPYCSNCEYVFGEDEEFSPFWNYCPMCGARMENKK